MTSTYPGEPGSGDTRPNPLVRAAFAIERTAAVDDVARRIAPVAGALVRSPAVRDALQGRWLGHSAHPFFVTAPLGIWTGVSALDVFGDESTRDACRTLTGLGVLLGVPSVLTGLAEWTGTNTRDRRTATVHGLTNITGLTLYTWSWVARRRGGHVRGAVLAATAYALVNVGGFLGGHLTEARKVGSHHPAIAEDQH
jgi:hypothetical protein